MKRILLPLLIMIMVTCIQAQNKAETSILANFEFQEECWNKQDMECYCQAYADNDSIRTISRVGVTYGLENILSDYKKWPKDKMGRLYFDELKMEKLSSKFYFVTGRFNLEYTSEETRSGYFSAIMKKQGSGWKIYTDHSS